MAYCDCLVRSGSDLRLLNGQLPEQPLLQLSRSARWRAQHKVTGFPSAWGIQDRQARELAWPKGIDWLVAYHHAR